MRMRETMFSPGAFTSQESTQETTVASTNNAAFAKLFTGRWIPAKNGDDIFGGNDKQLIVGFEIHGNRVSRVKQDFVVVS